MPQIIHTDTIDPFALSEDEREWLYNGMDCMMPIEIHDRLMERADDVALKSYEFSRQLLGPAMAMMLRGLPVDVPVARRTLAGLGKVGDRLRRTIDAEAEAIWGKPLNPNSFPQKMDLFYGHMKLPEQHNAKGKATTDKGALKILYNYAPALVGAMQEFGGLKDLKRVLSAGIDRDGRMRGGFNVCGTETGRWSSAGGAMGGGTNLQNVPKKIRNIFRAPDGWVILSCDLSRSDSMAVAYYAEDEAYIQAHLEEDLHRAVASIVFGIPIGEVNDAQYKIGKGCQHALNYFPGGRSRCTWMLHKRLGIPIELAEEFVKKSFSRFGKVRDWQRATRKELLDDGALTNAFGRRRKFFSKLTDDHTFREAVSYRPQSTTSDVLNWGLLNVWHELDGPDLEVVAQVHDEIVMLVRAERLDVLVPEVLRCMKVPVEIHGRIMTIPSDAKAGPNWRDIEDWHGAKI